ncbi:MAG: ThiF family adenylyltransferase [Desulfobulbaceae bacterium]|nr:ThiF family adenylyltransferase [Desulfobulbaceae bacterium]
MEGFDFKNSLSAHPNVTSLKEISLNDIATRAVFIKDKLAKAFIAIVQVGPLEYQLFIGEPKGFPGKLPWIFFFNPELHDFHNHVNYNGEICYTVQSDGMFINVNQPGAVLHQALSQVIEILSGSADRNLSELHEEFEGYWHSLPGIFEARCFFTPTQNIDQITALCNPVSKQNFTPRILFKEPLPEGYGYNYRLKSQQSRKAWHIPLEKKILPPNPDAGLTPFYVRNLLDSASESHKIQFLKSQEKKKKKGKKQTTRQCDILLFSQMRPSGAMSLFGVVVTGTSKTPFFLSSEDKGWELIPFSIQRHNLEYILERGGAQTSLQKRTVAIFGCGAVGSRIVEQLALSGIGKLIIFDSDDLSEDNIYRHVLGGKYIDENKAGAMAKYLKERLPYISVVPKPIKSDQWLQKKELEGVDIIVDATADFTSMRAINQNMIQDSLSVPIVYCWLEPCSIGGHSLLVDGIAEGCLECLFDNTEFGPFLRCAFLEPYQNLTKDLTGCGGVFTPFSSLDAIKTATLSTELVIEYLLKKQTTSYSFWVGNDDIAKKEGLKTTEWYKKAANKNSSEIAKRFRQKHCPACGGQI